MATIELQTTAELAESRRKMQAKRRMKNRIALALSMATMAFGLFWLIWILMATITRGFDGMSLALFTEMTPPPNTAGGGLANALAGSGLLILWATVFGTPLGFLLAGVGGDVLVGKDGSDSVPEPVAHFAELEKSGAHRHDQAGAEQQRQTRRAPDHSVHCIVDLRDPFQHGKFPPLTQNKKADRTHQRLCLQNSGAFIFRCRARRIPGGALVRIRRWLCPFA